MNNYHNEYALPLETKAREALGINERHRGAIYDADSIELSTFFEVMLMTLRVKSEYQRSSVIEEFIMKYANLLGKKLDTIEKKIIDESIREFELILNKIDNDEL